MIPIVVKDKTAPVLTDKEKVKELLGLTDLTTLPGYNTSVVRLLTHDASGNIQWM